MPHPRPGDDLAAASAIRAAVPSRADRDSGSPGPDALSRRIEAQLEQWTRLVRRVASRFELDASDTDELAQDVRIRVWHALEGAREKRSGVASSYMYAAVMSAAIDLLRRRRRRRAAVSLDALTGRESATPRATTSGEPDLAGALDTALAGLSETRRVAVRLHLEGKDLADIATLTGWTSAQARNLLYRGLNDLRESLQRMGHG